MRAASVPVLPQDIGGVAVPQDVVSEATWVWAHRALPAYLRAHSIRSFCWGAEIARVEGHAVDRQVLWTASLMHDVGLTTIPTNTMCFEVDGAERARRFLVAHGMSSDRADRAAIAIILHMQPGVTLADGVESLLLDRATAVDVRGDGYAVVAAIRPGVMRRYPRGDFDRHFLRAIEREVASRPGCQSRRLLHEVDLAGWMARSPWRAATDHAERS